MCWPGVSCVVGPGAVACPVVSTAATAQKRRARQARKALKRGELLENDGKCGAQNKRQGVCSKPAGWGTQHVGTGRCKLHGGSLPTHQKRAELESAVQAVHTYGLPIETDPHQALLDELYRTAGHVAWLGSVVAAIEDGSVVGPVGVEGMDAESGLVHHPEYKASVWVGLYQAERNHLTGVASACIKAGIEERRVRVAEQQGQLLAQVITAVLADLKVPLEKARPVIRKHLTLLAGEAAA